MDTNYLDFGVPISFGWTAQYLDTKTQTRRQWKDSHAAKFLRAYERAATAGQQLRVPAIDKGYHAGGKQIGWCVIRDRPYQQRLGDMPEQDLFAEGGMKSAVADFISQYFKGDADLEVWVINFEFIRIEGESCSSIPEPIENPPAVPPLISVVTSSTDFIDRQVSQIALEGDRARWQLASHLKMFEALNPDGTLNEIQRQVVDNFAIGWQITDAYKCEDCKMTNTNIEWTDKVWNPVTGCDKVSPGCTHCYAEALTKRFHTNFPNGFDVTLHYDRLTQPRKWKKPSRIFVNSMSDLFHDEIPFSFIEKVFYQMECTPRHTYQILTKRHERLLELAPKLKWSDNIWMGVSGENQDYANSRINALRAVPAKVRFLSCEPLLGPLQLDLTDIHWVIVGGESGQRYRPICAEWVRDIRTQCEDAGVAFFFKQWGGRTPKAGGRLLDGQVYDAMPA